MNDEQTSAQAEGEALPESAAQHPIDTPLRRVFAAEAIDLALGALERWYAAHFHAAALAGRAPITAEEKASLIQHVTEALTPKE